MDERLRTMKWSSRLHEMFPAAIPDRAGWADIQDIGRMIQALMDTGVMAIRLPGADGSLRVGGDLRQRDATTLEIQTEEGAVVFSPDILRLESLGVQNMDSLFLWLELYPLPITPYIRDTRSEFTERLCEIAPNVFLSGQFWDSQKLPNGEKLPEDSQLLHRCLSGSLILHKVGELNYMDPSVTSPDELREKVEKEKSKLLVI